MHTAQGNALEERREAGGRVKGRAKEDRMKGSLTSEREARGLCAEQDAVCKTEG